MKNKFSKKLNEKLPDIKWEAEDIHNTIYEISEKEKYQLKLLLKPFIR